MSDAVVDKDIIRAGTAVAARRLDADSVGFAVADADERDALIERAPAVYFTNARFADVDIVLARLVELDEDTVRDRLHAAWKAHGLAVTPVLTSAAATPAPKPAPTGPRLFLLFYLKDVHKEPESKNERRTFRELGHGHVDELLARWWRAFAADKAWGTKLPEEAHRHIESAFEGLSEEDVVCPKELAAAKAAVAEHLSCKQHVVEFAGDDDEGLYWEFTIFDEEYMADEASGYLPHPERGERKKNRDDGYRELLRKHRKFMHAVGRKGSRR